MLRKFITNLGLLVLLNLLIKPLYIFGIDRAVQVSVGAADYGIYFTLLNFTYLFNIFLDLGITNFNNRNIAQNQQLLTKHFSNLFLLRFILAIGYVLITGLVAIALDFELSVMKLLGWLMLNQFFVSMTMFNRSNLAGLHQFVSDSLLSVIDRALLILLLGSVIYTSYVGVELSILNFVLFQTATYGISFLLSTLLVLRNVERFKMKIDWRFFAIILKQSYPFALLIIFMTFYTRVDAVMIERMLPDGQVQAGIYAQGFRLLDAFNMVGFMFASLLLPIFARMLKLNEALGELVRLSSKLLLSISMVLGFGSWFFGHQIMELLYVDHIESSTEIFKILMINFVPIALMHVTGTLLTANGSLKQFNLIAGSGVLLNVFLNYMLIPSFEAKGAAIASLCTQSLVLFIQLVLIHRMFTLGFNWNQIIRVIVLAICLYLIGYLTMISIPFTGEISWKEPTMYLCGALGVLLWLKFINIKDLKQIIENKSSNK